MSSPDPQAPRPERSTARALAWGVALFNLLIVVFAVATLTISRAQYIQRAEQTTHNLAQVLEENLLATIHQIDLVLLAVKDEAERPGPGDGGERIETSLATQFPRLKWLDALRTADADGFVNHGTSILKAQPHLSIADRGYFQQLKAHPEAGLVVSPPLVSRFSGKWVMILARRLNKPKDGFGGIVYATIPLDHLNQLLSRVDVGGRGSISLRGADLSLITRYPSFPGLEQLIGDTRVEGEYLDAVRSGLAVSHFSTHSRLDGEVRTYTFRRLSNPTLFLLVSLGQADYLHPWRKEALLAGLAVMGLIVLSAVVTWMAKAAWRRQLAAQDRLAQEEAKYRLLAENALDVIWTADAEGRVTYISPSILRQRGWTPEEAVRLSLSDRTFSAQGRDQLYKKIAGARNLPAGSQPFETEAVEVSLRHKDGREIQVEVRMRIVWGEDGSVQGLQGVTRDVTERKRMEAERDRLILELTQALAEVKTLKGMLPICSHCKKVRGDHGYWKQIETYLSEHTEATFTHGVCPDCAAAFRAEMQARRAQAESGEDV
ncbi:hypothetical protein GETHLI_33070 [Geothrix limicola]|uniref:PAS domain S-box protein n=1 Tax=Geothrix limicola TaxID=2927978 RepID=A0ABQ5QKD6_9BACT|nr:PAS domain S-box protein [Geothrix limicola]GLH74805.1 hypothetical protein GETHLI_33070 [Geothrix limicola]